MAKKKNKSQDNEDKPISTTVRAVPSMGLISRAGVPSAPLLQPQPTPQPSTSALIICRNKHWRYISSFHGPWLQLPPEVLESLANSNYNLPRPQPIAPAVFFDLLKIRRLVDEATDLAVRAASGVASSAHSQNANNSLLTSSATALGIGGGATAKLSRERKHRMREQATQKLSKAYHLDEIACSVATMQSASTLEDVAQHVLQRIPLDADAKYVHFFHEKIPSRQLAECTSLQPLDEIITDKPHEVEIIRTRAVTRMFKNDFTGACRDLTLALQSCRYRQGQHREDQQQIELAAKTEIQQPSRRKEETKLEEKDHPSSLEAQLLFHRAGVYLTVACQHVDESLQDQNLIQEKIRKIRSQQAEIDRDTAVREALAELMEEEGEEVRTGRWNQRKIVKTNAKRALRDYMSFLSHLDYSPGLPAEITEEFVRKVNQVANGFKVSRPQYRGRGLDLESNSSLSKGKLFDSLVPHKDPYAARNRVSSGSPQNGDRPSSPVPEVFPISNLFSATPPSNLPPYPETSTSLTTKQQIQASKNEAASAYLSQADCHEAVTYHPLLTDALHSVLLCHCLIQTSARELQRHAHMVARLARICDGYPIFQAARSPSRADWIEVVRCADNWIQLQQTWEDLCAPAPLPGQVLVNQQKETPAAKKERLRHQAIMEALEDDRVNNENTFHAAVTARQRRQEEDINKAEGKDSPKRWAQDDGKEYPISTERALAIVRWIKEAPLAGEPGGPPKKKKAAKPGAKGKANEESAEGEATDSIPDLKDGVGKLRFAMPV